MDVASQLAAAGAQHGTVVIADEQSSGRGRRGRVWAASPGALLLSVVLRPRMDPAEVAPITLAAGLGVCRAVNSLGAAASLKWPNDVYAGGRKLAGLLTEMSSNASTIDHVIVGIGINLGAVPSSVKDIATALSVSRDEMLEALLPPLESALDRFTAGGLAAIRDDWLALALLGGWVRVGDERGRAVDLDPAGALVIEDSAGRRRVVRAGEIAWESGAPEP